MVAQLSHKFVRSLPWAMGEAFFNTLYGVSVVVVIGRFIAPVELGVASTAIATVALIEVVSSAGLQEAVVRSRSADTDVTDTAFIMAMTFAVLGMVVCYLAALGVAAAFGDRRLIALVLVASLLLPFNALAAVPSAILRRKMRAGVLTRRIIAGKILGLFTLSIAGVSGLGSWSLVLANLATSLGSLVTILMAMNRWPRMRFARQEAGELLHFGAMVSAETILSAINTRTFGLLFGYFHGLAALGNFQLAVRLADEVGNLIHNTVARFGLSFFAGKERMAADTKASFLTGTQLIMAVTTPLFTGIALVAYDFIAVAFGSRWEASAPFIQIIAISMVAGFQNILVGPVLRARGQQTILVSYAAFATGFVMISCIATAQMPAIFGVIGFGSMQVLFEPFMALMIHLQISLKLQFTNVIGPLAAAASMAIAVLGFQLSLAGAVPIIRLVGSIMIGMIYPIALWFLSPAVVVGAKSLTTKADERPTQMTGFHKPAAIWKSMHALRKWTGSGVPENHGDGFANARAKRRSQPRNLVIRRMSGVPIFGTEQREVFYSGNPHSISSGKPTWWRWCDMPVFAPHWARNHDNISVAVAFMFELRSMHNQKRIYQVNRALRKFGAAPTPPGISPWRDHMKLAAAKRLHTAYHLLRSRRA